MADVKKEPLLVFFDTEAANGSVYYGDIVEIGARCDPEIHEGSFQTLINTQQDLCAFGELRCGLLLHNFESAARKSTGVLEPFP